MSQREGGRDGDEVGVQRVDRRRLKRNGWWPVNQDVVDREGGGGGGGGGGRK